MGTSDNNGVESSRIREIADRKICPSSMFAVSTLSRNCVRERTIRFTRLSDGNSRLLSSAVSDTFSLKKSQVQRLPCVTLCICLTLCFCCCSEKGAIDRTAG